MTNETIRIGLIGAGAIGSAYLDAICGSNNASLAAITDVDTERAAALGEQHGVPAYASAEDLAAAGECDAVIICTPPSTHAAIAKLFLEQGIAVLCEKPLSIGTQAAIEMVETAAKHGALLTMASKFRYVEDVIRARRIVESGVLGEIVLFENSFTSQVDMSSRWNSDPSISGGGVLIDNGTHSVDIARYFLGRIDSVMAVEGRRSQSVKVEDTAQMFLRNQDGVLANIDLSWSLNKNRSSFVDIYGTSGTIRIGWQASSYRQTGNDEWIRFGNGYRKLDALRAQIDNFAAAIQGREPILITAIDAIASVHVIEAAYESIDQRTWVSVRGSFDESAYASPTGLLALNTL